VETAVAWVAAAGLGMGVEAAPMEGRRAMEGRMEWVVWEGWKAAH